MNYRNLLIGTAPVNLQAPNETGSELKSVAAADPMADFAHELPDDINQFLEALVEKKEDVQLSSFDLFVKMQKELGEDFDNFPRVGTSWNDKPASNNPETYQAWDTEKQKNVERNYFTVYVANTKVGMKYRAVLDDLNKASKSETQNESKLYRDMAHDSAYIKDETNKYQQRLSSVRSMIRNAVRIRDVLLDLSEYNESIVVKYNTYVDGNGQTQMKRSKYPFRLADAKDHSIFKPLSTGDLLKYNRETIAKAVANGSTYKAFVDAIARGQKEPSGTGTKITVSNIEELEDHIAAVTNYIDFRSQDGRKHKAALQTLLTAKRAENESLILQIGLLYHSLGSIYQVIESAYERLTDKLAAATGETVANGEDKAA